MINALMMLLFGVVYCADADDARGVDNAADDKRATRAATRSASDLFLLQQLIFAAIEHQHKWMQLTAAVAADEIAAAAVAEPASAEAAVSTLL